MSQCIPHSSDRIGIDHQDNAAQSLATSRSKRFQTIKDIVYMQGRKNVANSASNRQVWSG